MTDISQTDNPTVTEPKILDTENLKPAADLLAEKLKASPATTEEQPVKRGRGRPPGSKNKRTLAREAQENVRPNATPKLVPPRQKATPASDLTPSEIVEHKKARAEYYAGAIANEINDKLLMVLMSAGVPVDLLYQPGQAPIAVNTTGKYTQLGAAITISPMAADIFGKFAAELEATQTGQKTVAKVGAGKGPLILYGIMSLAAGAQFANGLVKVGKVVMPLLAAQKEAQQASANKVNEAHQQGYHSTPMNPGGLQ